MLLSNWRGYLIAWLALVAIANVYMSIYSRVRVEIRKERAQAESLAPPNADGKMGRQSQDSLHEQQRSGDCR